MNLDFGKLHMLFLDEVNGYGGISTGWPYLGTLCVINPSLNCSQSFTRASRVFIQLWDNVEKPGRSSEF